jgi:hypothetical protein
MSLRKTELTIEEGLERFDTPARRLAKLVGAVVIPNVVKIQDHSNEYSIDLIGYDASGAPLTYLEVECSTAWKTEHFPWPRLSYLEERKGRYLYQEEYQDLDMYFMMFNHNFTSFALTNRRNILGAPIETDRRQWKGKEKFRMIHRMGFKVYSVKKVLNDAI